MVEEITSGANTAFSMYPGLAGGAAEVIAQFGTEAQKKLYAERMFNGTWGGTMCLTESHAGSDVGARVDQGRQAARRHLQDHRHQDLHLGRRSRSGREHHPPACWPASRARPQGTKGLSLFIVPRVRVNADGSLGEHNDVTVAGIEHKMGINGSATCSLNFGENDGCIGELVGTAENQGMPQMFRMMNGARIGVGIQGVAVAGSAYLNALEYAKDRKQGSHFTQWKDPKAPRVSIMQHPDVRRMLLELKATTEGLRSLVVKLASHRDQWHVLAGKDDDKAAYHMGQVELLTPLVKAFSSDEAFRLSAVAQQVYGGAGFLKDWPVEQYTRDAKIFSIYEGTNHIQAMDLVARKLGQNGGANFQGFIGDLSNFVEAHKDHPVFGKEVQSLSGASDAIMGVAMNMMGWSQAGKIDLVPLVANRFLLMMSQLAVSYLLLDAGVKAEAALAKLPEGHADRSFYEGKRYSALWYARNVLPQAKHHAEVALLEDESPMKISDEAFGHS